MKIKKEKIIRVMLVDDEENALNIMELFLADFKENIGIPEDTCTRRQRVPFVNESFAN